MIAPTIVSADTQQVTHLLLHLRLETEVFRLIQEIGGSRLIPQDQINKILEGFSEEKPNDIDEQKWLSLQLAYIIHHVLEPAIKDAADDKTRQYTLYDYLVKVERYLGETVSGQTVDQFMQGFKQAASKAAGQRERWERSTQNAQVTKQTAKEIAERIQTKILTEFENLRRRLQALNDQRGQVATELNSTLKELEGRIKNINLAMTQIAQDQADLADQIKSNIKKF